MVELPVPHCYTGKFYYKTKLFYIFARLICYAQAEGRRSLFIFFVGVGKMGGTENDDGVRRRGHRMCAISCIDQ